LATLPRPEFITLRTDPWAIGDRVAWRELPASDFAYVKHLTRLASALKPVAARSQLIHGDLTGNVLFDDRLPPAVIDLAPYWRSTAFASAIVVADALVWEGAEEGILDAVSQIADFDQLPAARADLPRCH
jgi:Ser/Thr protein kinase RdoA (MazF antagonist)